MADMKKNTWCYYIISFFLISFDQITKLLVKGFNFLGIEKTGFELGESYNLIGDTVRITFVENTGMAFGISFGPAKVVLSLFSVAASGFLVYYLYKLSEFSKFVKLGIALILAGAVGNLIDRVFYGVLFGYAPIFYGKVIDFVQIDIPDIDFLGIYYTHWPVFNVADSCITVGVIVLLLFNKHIPSFSQVFKKVDVQKNEN